MDEMRRAMGHGDAPNDAADFDSPQAFRGRARRAEGSSEVRAAAEIRGESAGQ